jgi:hypothetical protein
MKIPFSFWADDNAGDDYEYNNPYNTIMQGLRTLSVMSDTVPRNTQFLDTWVYNDDSALSVRVFDDAYVNQQKTALASIEENDNAYSVETCEIDISINKNFHFEEDWQNFNLHGIFNLIFYLGVNFPINFTGKVPNAASLPSLGNLYDLVITADDGERYWWNPSTTSWVLDQQGNFIYNGGDVSKAFNEALYIRRSNNQDLQRLVDSYNGIMPAAIWYPSFQINKYKI